MTFRSTQWVWSKSENTGGYPPITIEECRQRDGSVLYAIRQSGACMNHEGDWEYEPIPSSRDDKFMVRCRFGHWSDAARMIEWKCKPKGRFQNQGGV